MEDEHLFDGDSAGVNPIIIVLRWIAFLPAAIVGAVVAHVASVFINRITAPIAGVDPDGLFYQLSETLLSNTFLGLAFVYIAAYVVPSHKSVVAIVMAGLLVFGMGIMFVAVLSEHGFNGLLAVVGALIGSCGVAFAIAKGEMLSGD
jgi:hypothetical protein